MRSDYLKTHMMQHEKEKYESETFCSTSITLSTTSLDKVSDFSLDSTIETYEISPLEREQMTKRLIKMMKNINILLHMEKIFIKKLINTV